MKMLKPWMFFIVFALTLMGATLAQAQTPDATASTVTVEANAGNQNIEMADKLRSDGKIYVVVACVLVVLIGMIIYLISIDKKVGQLEKQNRS